MISGPQPFCSRYTTKIRVHGWRSRWYQVPDLPPRSAGVAGPAGTNPALASTFWDAALPWEVAARSVQPVPRRRNPAQLPDRPGRHVHQLEGEDRRGMASTQLLAPPNSAQMVH
jgi:hypothetical protein